MADVTAREKFHCPSCGADAHWHPGKQELVCPYCATVAPGTMDHEAGRIVEHDLVTALRQISSEGRGWKAEKKSVKCQSCQAISVMEPNVVGQRCCFCGSAQIVPYEEIKPPISPQSLLPFQITESEVREKVREWYGAQRFAPNKLKTEALTDTLKGVYLPYWTFDALGHANWTAQSGYYSYTTENYTDAQGKQQTRRVRHTRWETSSGSVQHFFDDALVSASRGMNPQLLSQIEPYPTKELVPYDASYLAGWIVEHYQIDLIAAAQSSRAEMNRQLEKMCESQVPGDTHRSLRVSTAYVNPTFKHALFPVWLLTYRYGKKHYQVMMNGYTGKMAGKHPLSVVKIGLLVIAVIALVTWVAVKYNP